MPSLDSINYINDYDRSGMASVIKSFPDQCRNAKMIGSLARIPESLKVKHRNIVCTGMGGSAIGADIARSYLAGEVKAPMYVNRNFTLPAFVGKGSLVVVSSYSGNTEETISAFNDARRRRARIIVITSGGKLARMARKLSLPIVIIPSGLQPRAAIGYSFFTLITILSRIGVIADKTDEISEAITVLARLDGYNLGPEVPVYKNIAKKIARQIYLKIPVIYSGQDHMDAVGTRWRGQLAENAKTIAFSNVFPEMAHNEIVGWRYPKKLLKEFVMVILKDRGDNSGVARRMEIVERIVKRQGAKVIEVSSVGKGLLARIFSLIYIGDYVSFYLAMLNNCDPTPVESIAYLKKELAKR